MADRGNDRRKGRNSGKKKLIIRPSIGTVIFGALFVYLLITFFLFITAHHIVSYQVMAGPLSKNETYEAIVLRDEEVITATEGGYISYFTSDASRVSVGEAVCAVSDTADLLGLKELTPADISSLRTVVSQYSQSYDPDHFSNVYDLQNSLNDAVLMTSDRNSLSGTIYASQKDALVAFSCDGYEYLTQDDMTIDVFNSMAYQKQNLRADNRVNAGEPLYRTVKSDTWSIVIPVTDQQTVRLASHSRIKVVFDKDGMTQTGRLILFKNGDQRFVRITFTSGMYRYCNDRYLTVELVTNTRSGLKIPLSSIVMKEFYLVPDYFQTRGGGDGSIGFLKEVVDEDGRRTTSFAEAVLYAEMTDEETGIRYYYVDKEVFDEGDILIQPDSSTRYTVRDTGMLEGVYSTNKGYAVFRKVVIIDQNEEYCIVESGTNYGISQFDYIVLNAADVDEKDLLYH